MELSPTEKPAKIQVLISESLNDRLTRAAQRCGITKSAFIRVALEREFALDQQLAVECARRELGPQPAAPAEISQPALFEIEDLPGLA